MKLKDKLIEALRKAGKCNSDTQDMPVCILWTDKKKEWEPVIPLLLSEFQELLIYGAYDETKRTGPAIWLKCMIDYVNKKSINPQGYTPVIYLPGISIQDIRPGIQCDSLLKPLAELKYRGDSWVQSGDKDWSVYEFLTTHPKGPHLYISSDSKTIDAIHNSISYLFEESISHFPNKRLDYSFFNQLPIGGDWIRDLLLFLDDNNKYRDNRKNNQWNGFVESCKTFLSFDPEKNSIEEGIILLANHNPPWGSVWTRFTDSHRNTTHILEQLRKIQYIPDPNGDNSGWPQWNESEENKLREKLKKIIEFPIQEALKILIELNELHKKRRTGIWSDLGEASLAHIVENLIIMLDIIIDTPSSGSFTDLEANYNERGWEIDNALLNSLSHIDKYDDLITVKEILNIFYIPWANEMARKLQDLFNENTYPGANLKDGIISRYERGECILFVNSLRFDLAKRLSTLLSDIYHIEEKPVWTALPTINSTCKPAVSPITHLLKGTESSMKFEPSLQETGEPLNPQLFSKLISEVGWQFLEKIPLIPKEDSKANLSPESITGVWIEYSDIDIHGNNNGWKLSKELNRMLNDIVLLIHQLVKAGWKKIHIITDHGWLLLPGGLPKHELISNLTEIQWGRFAQLKQGVQNNEKKYPWYWNQAVHFAIPPGIHCYNSEIEFASGGLSFQECLTLHLTIKSSLITEVLPNIQDVSILWKKFRCDVSVTGEYLNLILDIRIQANTPETSVINKMKPFNEDGKVSVVIEDDSLEGKEAFLVICDEKGKKIKQYPVIIGGGTL